MQFSTFENVINFFFFKGEDFVEYFIALKPSGVAVYKNKTRVGSYLW